MLPLPRGAAWQTLFLLCAVIFINEIRSEGRVVCYYTNWSVYRPGTAKFNPQNINPYLCTHLVYAFGGFTKDNQMKPFDKYQDVEQGGYAKFTGLKTYNKQLKTMIAIGGWNEASSRFSPLMANPERRQQFIKNILKFLRQNHFDGIDLDWEYPAQREGGKQRDRDNYAQFVQELRAEFERESEKTGRPRLLLTMAVPAGIENIEKGYDIPKLNKYLDWFNVLTYDFHSSHEPSANHHAPLYSLEEESEYNYDAELNIDYSVKYYLKAGADRDKLVLGIPTYGRSYTLINEESTEIGAPSEGPGEQGDATREKGYLAYYEICQNLKDDPEWTVVQPNPNAMGPYAYRRTQWVGYDDEAIVRKKAQYVVEHGLGGIMFWAIDNDDFRGTCNGKPYPLIEAAKEAMLEGLGVGINEVAKPNNQHKKPSRSRSRENSSSKLNRIGGGKEGKGSTRTTLSSGRRRPSTTTTTERAPETTIRLTNPEGSSLYIGGRTTTPPPPTTPDPGADFKCEEEGFFQHPRDCKKYYWCLDSGPSGLGIVGHQFTCPSGLYFNPAADSCDFARNVPCKIKKATTPAPGGSIATPRPTSAPNRIIAATSRTSFFRTTTSTSTTPEPIEYEDEEEEVDEALPTHTKERDSEEDPQVLKELIDLIRKVGGIEELEKHLQRKEDGTIALKNGGIELGASTTQSPISKNLYDKVLSKPNTYNSFRNRLTSTSLYRKTGQAKVAEKESTKTASDDAESSEVTSAGGSSKYSSVVRGNSRQGPQNEGLDKLSDFDGFLKEKKQYVTINRHRGAFRNKAENDEDNETEAEEKKITVIQDEEKDDEDEETITEVKSTKRPTNTVTPSYASIRRTRPPTIHTDNEEEAINEEDVKSTKESEEKRRYTLLSRNRGKYTTESSQASEETVTNTNRYKYLERTRPTSRTQSTLSAKYEEEITPSEEDDDSEDEDNQEEEQNIRTPTATTIITATAPTRRPLLSVRRRKINTPNASSGIAYQTAITSALTGSTTTSQTATTITTANTFSTKNDDLQIITTELPTTFNKQQQQHQQQLNRNRTKLVAPALTTTATSTALTTTTTITDLTAPSTTTSLLLSQPSSSPSPSSAPIILNSETSNSGTNFKPYFNTKYRAKLLATTLSTGASPTTIISTTPTIEGAAAATTKTTSNGNDIIQTANANTKQPSTLLRRKFQTRRLITTTTLSPTDVSGTDQPRTQNPLFKRRFSHPTSPSVTAVTSTPADSLTTTLFVDGFEVEDPADQVAKSSINTNHFDQFLEQAEAIKEPVARQELTSGIKASTLKASFASKTKSAPAALYSPIEPNHAFAESITRRMGTVSETTEHTTSLRKSAGNRGRPQKYTPTTPQTPAEPVISRRAQTVSRRRPNKYAGSDNYDRLNSYQHVPVKKASPGVHRSNHKQVVDYDYYDDDFERVVGNTKGQQLKVILHGRGIIECLDQGNFPHPLSCRKFISCAKFETGGVVGWEYTCPKGLSYDPVGGMCNWSAGLGCKE